MEIINKYFTSFTPKQLEQFNSLADLYKEWNEKINVVSRKDIDALYERHVLHSLSIATIFDFKDGAQILDLGTGGGFPGIPLAIFFPNVNFLLVDSIQKKLKVVEAVASALEIKNIQTRHARAEVIKGQQFDFVVSRAVAALGSLWQWSKPLLKKKDSRTPTADFTQIPGLICLKGGDLTQEILDSNTKPRVWDIHSIFPEEFFQQKYVLQVT